jgi:hypothetical protein
MRSTCGSAAPPARILFARSSPTIGLAGRVVRSPSRSPAPCTAVTGPTTQRSRTSASTRRTLASRSPSAMASRVATIIAQASGPPPKVLPSAPWPMPFVTSAVASTAPAGKPPATPLATVSRSGTTSARCAAKGQPVRPMPHCTSSRINRTPAARVSSRAARSHSTPTSTAPPTPCTGSTMSAATSLARRASSAAASAPASWRGRNVTGNGACGNACHFAEPQVTAPAAAVRPWKLPSSASTRVRPVWRKAILSAFSLASAPLLTRKTRSSPAGAKPARRAAACSRTASGSTLLWKSSACACSASAARSRGWACPRSATAWPPQRSSTRRPSASKSQTPSPRTGVKGSSS